MTEQITSIPLEHMEPDGVVIGNVPFYANTEDDMHCYQAAIASVLKYFQPDKDYTFSQLDEMSAKKEGLWTWQSQMSINLINAGYEVISVDDFDMQGFVSEGGEYLRRKYGNDVAETQIKNSDIKQEQQLEAELLEIGNHTQRIPTIDDIRSMLQKGYLLICNVNSMALNDAEGYVGHFVVVFGVNGNQILFHDPGLPPTPNRAETIEKFTKAWAYPNEEHKNLFAYKLPQDTSNDTKPSFVEPK